MNKLLPVIFLAAIVLTHLGCGGGGGDFNNNDASILRSLSGLGIPKSDAGFRFSYTTPMGASVTSTVPVPAAFLHLVDVGAQKQINRYNAVFPGWVNFRKVSDTRVLLVDPTTFHLPHPRDGEKCFNLENDPGAPCILVQGGQTAGTVIGVQDLDPTNYPYIVAPHQQDSNWSHPDYFENTIANEREHADESRNDRELFMRFQGFEGEVHPHKIP